MDGCSGKTTCETCYTPSQRAELMFNEKQNATYRAIRDEPTIIREYTPKGDNWFYDEWDKMQQMEMDKQRLEDSMPIPEVDTYNLIKAVRDEPEQEPIMADIERLRIKNSLGGDVYALYEAGIVSSNGSITNYGQEVVLQYLLDHNTKGIVALVKEAKALETPDEDDE